MPMRSTLCVASALCAAVVPCARADIETFRTPFSSSFPSITPVNVGIPQFNTMNGTRTLQAVQLEFHYNPNFRLTIENNSASPQTTGGQFDLLMAGLAPGGINLASFLLSGSVPTQSLAPADGILNSGPDYFDFGRLALDGRRSFNASTLSSYIGNGLVNTRVTFLGLNLSLPPIPPINPFRATIIDGRFDGDVAVTYTFIPTPGSASLLLALGALAARRRR